MGHLNYTGNCLSYYELIAFNGVKKAYIAIHEQEQARDVISFKWTFIESTCMSCINSFPVVYYSNALY